MPPTVLLFVFLLFSVLVVLVSSNKKESYTGSIRIHHNHEGSKYGHSSSNSSSNSGLKGDRRRRLQADGSGGRARTRREIKRSAYKYEKLKQAVKKVESQKPPESLQPESWCKPHNKKENAIFAAAMDLSYTKFDVEAFAGTMRRYGYTGDIVLAVLPNSRPGFLQAVRDYGCIVYATKLEDCTGKDIHKRCKFASGQESYSVNMMRFYLYQWWGLHYNEDSMILISDFRDVFFQSNPFHYKNKTWGPPDYQLAVFQESFPNKMIYRCIFNSGWIKDCYGQDAYNLVAENMVSCSGVTIGTRDALIVYAYLMTQQLDPKVRYSRSGLPLGPADVIPIDNKQCSSNGVDQGFHNFLLYSGQLEKLMDVKYFPQGEGPVNTVGAFSGQAALIKMNLREWKILRGEPPNQEFFNWNGDPSPCVHQYDRYMKIEFDLQYEKHLKALKNTH